MVTIDSAKLSLDVVVTAKDLDSEIITTSETIRNLTVSMGTISQLKGDKGDPGVSVTHSWNGTVLSLTSASGTTSVDLIGPKGDAGDMDSSVYDSNRNGIVDNAEKVNNHTVESDVPANAKFTDTVYTAGTGILITDGVISNTNVSAIWGNITGNLNNQTDLQNYLNSKADKTYVDSTFQPIGVYLTEVPAEYVTESELLAVQNQIPSITGLASEVWVTNRNYLTSFTESDPTVGNHIKSITPTDITNWNSKVSQSALDETTAIATSKYTKDPAGIPLSDLTSSVQASLVKADTSIQSLAGYATELYVSQTVANLVNSAPTTLDTLNELAAALGDDPNFATTVANQIGTKADQSTTYTKTEVASLIDTKQDALGYVPENSVNKVTTIDAGSTNTQYPSALAVYTSLSNKVDSVTLASVATTGSYNSLSDKPTIPTIPTSLKNPYSLSFGTKSYDGSSAQTITLDDIGGIASVNWSSITNAPTTVFGYGITDAKIVNGVITLGGASITPITEHQSLMDYALKSELPTTQQISNWNTAYTNNHTHSNKTAIDGITAALITNWNTAFTNNHTHGNKAVIDGITSALVSNWNTAFTNNHTHSNKAVLDSLTQAVINNSHTHSNRAALDKITLDVDGNIMIDGNVYSTGGLSAYGDSPSGGAGGGIIQTVYGYTGLGDTFSDTDLTNTFNAYTISRLASRLANVESGALTSVEWSIINGRPSSLSFFTNDCGFVTASIVDGYATQSWVNSNFNNYSLPAASATVLGGVKVGTNLSISSGVLSATNTTYSAATTSVAGLMSAADKAKLEGIAAGANNYTYALPTATAGTLGGVMVGTGLGIASSVLSVTYGTAAGTACRGNDSRLSDARVASDVYAWAKASVKPIYTWTEITSRPTALSSFTNDSGYITASASITGNAATATTLQNSRTIWGQSFNGSGNISGAITGATTITASDVVTVGSLLSTGGITAYTTSDKRLKTNIVDFNAIELIKSMGGIYSFRYTNEAIQRDKTLSEHSYGVIAQNLQETILSDLVVENNGYLGVNYASPKLISLALKSVIEIDDEIIVLKNKVKQLENKVKQLECRA